MEVSVAQTNVAALDADDLVAVDVENHGVVGDLSVLGGANSGLAGGSGIASELDVLVPIVGQNGGLSQGQVIIRYINHVAAQIIIGDDVAFLQAAQGGGGIFGSDEMFAPFHIVNWATMPSSVFTLEIPEVT